MDAVYYDGDYPDDMFDETDMILDVVDGTDETEPSLREIYENCLVPSVEQFYTYVEILLFYTLVFRMGAKLVQRAGARVHFLIHLISIGCGNMILFSVIGSSALYCLAFIYLMYVCLTVFNRMHSHAYTGYTMGALCLTILTWCEFGDWNPAVWRQIRGVQMIATMKVVSLAFDMVADSRTERTNVLVYLGYMLCPANCVIGPWAPYGEYVRVVQHGTKLIDTNIILWTGVNFVLVFVFAMSSNCLVPAMIAHDSWKWLVAYRDALSFRCSHYFIAFLSQLTMVLGGFASHDSSPAILVGYRVVRPLSMELPRSLTQVVTDWNIPTHYWLKQYVFRPLRRRSISLAIFLTYLVSSMLHGMNFQLAAVLLSLGIFSLVEHKLRATMADYLDACVRANSCRANCDHRLGKNAPVCLIVNGLFGAFTMVHLAFLGMIFNTTTTAGVEDELDAAESPYRTTWNRWNELNLASYWICFGCLLCDILLRI